MNKTEYDEIQVNLIKKSLDKDKKDLYIPVERRKGEDGVLKFINLVCFLSWGVVFIIFSIIVKAGRSVAYIKQHDLLWLSSNFWRINLLEIALFVTFGCIVVCMMSIILNFTRHRRKSDRIKRSLIICEILCFIFGAFLILKIY